CVIGTDGNRDGLPTVLLEAMALGTSCVSTELTGIPEVVQQGVTGLLVPERSPELLADALQQLLLDSDLRTELAINARKLIENRFDIKKNSRKLRDIFDSSAVFKELDTFGARV
ncbi:MAG TPA: glycosyltransferase, partial [Acidobacteriota bacterium]